MFKFHQWRRHNNIPLLLPAIPLKWAGTHLFSSARLSPSVDICDQTRTCTLWASTSKVIHLKSAVDNNKPIISSVHENVFWKCETTYLDKMLKNIIQCFTLEKFPQQPKIIGNRGKATIVWASNTKITLTSENAASPNEKLLAIGQWLFQAMLLIIIIALFVRKPKQTLWEEAVKFLSANESRVRVETQKISGEDYAVWRWLQATVSQEQAFTQTLAR